MRVLGIGNAALDVVSVLEHYPREDAEVRAAARHTVRGGNTANTLVVLSQLGHRCAWGGVLADDPESHQILEDLARYAVDPGPCTRCPGGRTPVSHVWLSRATGSRTIVHFRDLPELRAEDFARIDLARLDWVHFEGREPRETAVMLKWVAQQRPGLRCSLEVEKPRDGIEALFDGPRVLLLSRAYARAQGLSRARDLLGAVRERSSAHLLFCAWGEQGGAAMDEAGRFWEHPALAPSAIVDTLGAGDAFNAGVIDALLRGRSPAQALEHACRLAGRKCAQQGFDGLGACRLDG